MATNSESASEKAKMERLVRLRRPVRREFDTLHDELAGLLEKEDLEANRPRIQTTFALLTKCHSRLQECDTKVMEQMASMTLTEATEDAEFSKIRERNGKFEDIRNVKDSLLSEKSTVAADSLSMNPEVRVRNFKLPTIELKKFSGELKDWLTWWAQFKKIDEDPHMHGTDKFLYLLQSLKFGTDAYELVAGYPQSDENYQEAIGALKRRYHNEDKLLQVYIRDLLNLVITNANAKEKTPIKKLYLKLDSHLRALKNLNLDKADPATWLYPMVESSLPEDILYKWKHHPNSKRDVAAKVITDGVDSQPQTPRTRLDLLMEYLEGEVEIIEDIDITKSFTKNQGKTQKQERTDEPRSFKTATRPSSGKQPVATLTSFLSSEKICTFCGMNNHRSQRCFKASSMSYEEKKAILRKNRLCYCCCGEHLAKDCKNESTCKVCNGGHITILCKDFQPKKREREEEAKKSGSSKRRRHGGSKKSTSQSEPEKTDTGVATETLADARGEGNVLLQTLLVKVCNDHKEVVVRAFIDTGCERSYLRKDVAKSLGLRSVNTVRVVHCVFGGGQSDTVVHNVYRVVMKSLDGQYQLQAEVRDQEMICRRLKNVGCVFPDIQQELIQKDVNLTDVEKERRDIDLLIGADLYPHILTGKLKRLECGAVAVYTELGWTLTGELKNTTTIEQESGANLSFSMVMSDTNITRMWDLDILGVEEPTKENEQKKEMELAREMYVSNIRKQNDGRYVVKLPWKDHIPNIPTNKEVAYKRLQSMAKKLKDSGLYNQYDRLFKDWEVEGFIERVAVRDPAGRVSYLPHRAVVKPESTTTPVRPVFDASCRVGKSPSLNDCLYTGENYTLLILELLLRFRERSVAFISDIRKAFQMIGVEPEDRDAQRFLWWTNEDMKELVEYRHARVVFGATCSPFILAAVLHYHLTTLPEEEREVGLKILSTLYVDNCVSSENTLEEYEEFKTKAIHIMSRAKMDLRMWMSNKDNVEDESTRIVSVLGLLWDRANDELSVNMKKFEIPANITKREILSVVHKIYDPIGFIAPCILPMKMILQQAWMRKAKWDEQLGGSIREEVLKWCEEASHLENVRIPRLSTEGVHDRKRWSLHVFTDASKDAYAAALFLRVVTKGGVGVQLLCAKARVSPVKEMSIPKLELMGCLIGARLLSTVKKALSIEHVEEYYHCDSTTALAWIRRDDQWGTWVANRVKEIVNATRVEQWRYVPGKENPADLPSRGCSPKDLLLYKWWEGPSWLRLPKEEWPNPPAAYDEDEIDQERRKGVIPPRVMSYSVVEDVRKSHTFSGLVRIVGHVRRFLHNRFIHDPSLRRSGRLRFDELKVAEYVLVRDIQRAAFTDEWKNKLTGLELFEDEYGVIRVKTRLTYREDLGAFRYPMLLPSKKEEVRQLIRETHRTYCHAGVGFLTTVLCKKYWILKARNTIRAVVSKCERCRRYKAGKVIPEPAPLPLDRIKDAEVFEVIGVDLAGPLILKNGCKIWMVIFTCAVYRAVHLELVKSLSTPAFLGALETFCEKYRRPAIIYSDNGTNFRGADNLFKRIDWKAVEEERRCSRIQWKFNPVTSSWWGGWFERLIRTAKELMRRTIGKGSLNWGEMKAIVKSVAEVMNNRPLTYISENPADLEPLTPALFLHPFGNALLPEKEVNDAERLRFRLKHVNTLRAELKARFLREYLSMLVNRNPREPTRELKVGELVLVGNDNAKRLDWPLGRVLEVIPGRDGHVRLARVKTEKGDVLRSVQRLFPMEAECPPESSEVLREAVVTRSGRRVRRPARLGD